jgi:2-polyprenyl-3-methyl-5-hydroxy-6-metoxy-1,4-benzoquinol methylase
MSLFNRSKSQSNESNQSPVLSIHKAHVVKRDQSLTPLFDDVDFELPPGNWEYGLSFQINPGQVWPIAIQCEVECYTGRFGLGCVAANFTDYVSAETACSSASKTDLTILIDENIGREQILHLVIRNLGDEEARGSIAKIEIIPANRLDPKLRKELMSKRHNYWHYSFDLGDGVVVQSTLDGIMDFQVASNKAMLSLIDDFFVGKSIKTVLDTACSSGFHSIQLAKRGWHVEAFDFDKWQIFQAELVRQSTGPTLNLRYSTANLFDFKSSTAPFDIVHCAGLIYHLDDLVGGAKRLYDLCKLGAVIHCHVADYQGDYLVFGDYSKYIFCGDYEFAFVPTMTMLEKILKHVGFADVKSFKATDIIALADINGLKPAYKNVIENHTAYFAAIK